MSCQLSALVVFVEKKKASFVSWLAALKRASLKKFANRRNSIDSAKEDVTQRMLSTYW